MSNSGVPSVGFGNPLENYIPKSFRGGAPQSSDPIKLLQSIDDGIQTLVAKLAPKPLMQAVQIGALGNGVAANNLIANIGLTTEYNAFLVTIIQGTVDVSFGGAIGSGTSLQTLVPDMQFNTTLNPLLVPFILRADQNISFWTDPNSAAAAIGKIFILAY